MCFAFFRHVNIFCPNLFADFFGIKGRRGVGSGQNTQMAKARNYCFTAFNLTPTFDDGKCRYLCWGDEVCPTTHREHAQGYVEFFNPVSIRSAQRILGLPGVHFDRRRGSAVQARDYCSKETGTFHEYGEISKQGKRNDLQTVRELQAKGVGMRGVLATDIGYQAARYAQLRLSYLECSDREGIPEVIWLWGPTGTGKTRRALAEATERYDDDVWWANGGVKWFDGYDAHKAVIFDDFRPEWCKLAYLLRLLDRYALRVPYKGGFRAWVPKVIYVTCPQPPSNCYTDSPEAIDQLLRRVTSIVELN